jgi:hypothetical protein
MAGMDINAAALKALAAVLVHLASAISDDGDRTVREWRHSQDFYVAPESPALLGALDPLIARAQTARDRIAGLAPVLDHYASEAERIIAEIRRLEASPAADAAAKADQAEQIARLKAELDALEADTVAKIRALFAANLVPERVRVSEEVVKASFLLSGGGVAGGLNLGQDATFKITRFSDGTLQVTVLNGQETSGVLHTPGLVDLGGGLTVAAGSTWKLQDEAEYEAFKAQLTDQIFRQRARLDPDGGAFGALLADELRPLRPPDLVIAEGATPFTAAFTVDKIPGLNVSGEGEATFKQTVTTDQATGATTTTTNREYSGSAGGELSRPGPDASGPLQNSGTALGSAAGGGLQGSGTGAVRDANGQLTKVILTTTERSEQTLGVGGQGEQQKQLDPDAGRHSKDPITGKVVDETTEADIRVTTTAIDISTPEERALAEEFLAAETNDAAGALDDRETYRPDRAVPGDAFQNLAHRKGIVTEQDFSEVTDRDGAEAGVDAGPEAGFEVGVETTRTELAGNRYLEPPGPDGVRRSAPTP